jgi:hypothetical protein
MITPMERGLITDLIFMYAEQIGLSLETNDVDDVLEIYENKKQQTNDIQSILLNALHSLQEEKVFIYYRAERIGKSSLVLA